MLFFVNVPCVICFMILFFSIVKIIIIHVKTFLLAALYHCFTNYPPKSLFKPFCVVLARVNLFYSVFVYILGKRKLDREKNCLKNL